MGVEHHHQWEEELVTVPLHERQNGTGINQPIEHWWRTHHNCQMVWVEELDHYSQKEIEDYHNNRQVEEELHHPNGNGNGNGNGDSNGSRGGDRPPPPRRDGDDDGDGGGDDSPPPSDHGQPRQPLRSKR